MLEQWQVTATRLRPRGRGQFGKELPAIEVDIPGCWIAPSLGSGQSASREAGDFQNTVVTGAALFLPVGSDLLPTDRVRVRGLVYEVEGEVGVWDGVGMQVSLRRSTG